MTQLPSCFSHMNTIILFSYCLSFLVEFFPIVLYCAQILPKYLILKKFYLYAILNHIPQYKDKPYN